MSKNFTTTSKHLSSPDTTPDMEIGVPRWIPNFKQWKQSLFYQQGHSGFSEYLEDHILCLGKAMSGKSETLKALALLLKTRLVEEKAKLDQNKSLIVIDRYGDLTDSLAQNVLFSEDTKENPRDRNLVWINLDEVSYPALNPFDVEEHKFKQKEISIRTELLSKSMSTVITENSPELQEDVQTILKSCIYVLLNRPGSTLLDLKDFMSNRTNTKLISQGKKLFSNKQKKFRFAQLFSLKKYKKARELILNKLLFLLINPLSFNLLCKPSTINLKSAIQDGKTIIIRGGIGLMSPSMVYTILASMVAGHIDTLNKQDEDKCRSAWLFVDDAQNTVFPDFGKSGFPRGFRIVSSFTDEESAKKSLGNNLVLQNGSPRLFGSKYFSLMNCSFHGDIEISNPGFMKQSGILLQKKREAQTTTNLHLMSPFVVPDEIWGNSDRKRKKYGLMGKKEWKRMEEWQKEKYCCQKLDCFLETSPEEISEFHREDVSSKNLCEATLETPTEKAEKIPDWLCPDHNEERA